MTNQEAKELLVRHSELNNDSLCPLTQEAFDGIFQALRVLWPQLQEADVIDKQVIHALWLICWRGKQRRGTIEPQVNFLSDLVLMIFRGEDLEPIFKRYVGPTTS